MSVENPRYCLTWQKAKDKGQDRGLTLSDSCPIASYCAGTRCAYIDVDKAVRDSKETYKKDKPLTPNDSYPYEW